METTGMGSPFLGFGCGSPAAARWGPRARRPPSTYPSAGGRIWTRSWYRVGEEVQVCLELGWERRVGLHALAGERVREDEPCGVQELAPEVPVETAVERVADDGQPDRREVDADLVHATCLEAHAKERVALEEALELEVSDRRARRVGRQRDPRRVVAVTPDGRFDSPGARAGAAGDEREVPALEGAAAHEVREAAVCLLRTSDDE